jgi:hypothetical protein
MRTLILSLVFFTGTLSYRVAFGKDEIAPPALGITLRQLKAGTGSVEGVASVHNAGTAAPTLHTVERNLDLRTSSKREPLDLWLVLDNSALCAKYRADQTLSAWASTLARELPSASRVSLLTFRRGAFETLATQQSIDSLPLAKLRCQPTTVSAEPERALAYVNETDVPSGLTRAVWILSSGNASISNKTLTRLRDSGSELTLLFYNPFVFNALAPLFDSMRSTMGDGMFYAQVLGESAAELPARIYHLQAALPEGAAASATLLAKVQAGDRKAVSAAATVKLPPAVGPSVLDRVLIAALSILLAVALGYAIFRVVRYYLARRCSGCKTRLRFSDATCPFCFEKDGAYLVAANPLGAAPPATHSLVSALHAQTTQVGTHRRSQIRCLRHLGEKRAVFFKIQRKADSFHLQTANLPVYVNGLPVSTGRYLASGDRIRVGGADFKFVQNQRSTARV